MLTAKNFADLVTFSRASTGWSFNSGGLLVPAPAGTPRNDYDPASLAWRGVLFEEPRVNLCTYSEFPNGVSDAMVRGGLLGAASLDWVGKFTTGLTLSGDGTTGAYAYKSVTFAPSTVHTLSVFVKMDDGAAPTFAGGDWSSVANDFALVIASNALPPSSYVVQALRDGIYRISATTTTSASPGQNVGIVKYGTNSLRSFKATGYQVEAGASASSYGTTLGAQATRAADIAAITDLSKIAFNPREGAIYLDFMIPRFAAGSGPDAGQGVFGFVGSYPNFLFGVGVGSTGRVNLYRTINGVTLGGLGTANGLMTGSVARLGVAWSATKGDAMCLNGGPVVTGTGTDLTGVTELRLGRFAGNPSYLNGWLRMVSGSPIRPDDSVFQARCAL